MFKKHVREWFECPKLIADERTNNKTYVFTCGWIAILNQCLCRWLNFNGIRNGRFVYRESYRFQIVTALQ